MQDKPIINNHVFIEVGAMLTHLRSVSILICIALAASPFLSFTLWTDTGYHNNQRILGALVLSTIPIWLLWRAKQRANFAVAMSAKIQCCLFAFFAIGLLSSLKAYSQRFALHEWSGFFLLLMLSWLIAKEIRIQKDQLLNIVLKLCGYGCALYIFKAILIYITIIAVGVQPKSADLVFGFDNYRFFNHIQSISLPMLGLLVARSRSRDGKWDGFWFAILSLWWMLLFVTSGRGTFVGLIAGLLVVIYYLRHRALEWLKIIVIAGILGFGAYLLFYVVVPVIIGLEPFGYSHEVAKRTLENPVSSRGVLWNFAWQMVWDRPWLGLGPLHFAHYGAGIQLGAHPHNWILQIASEWGIPALLFAMMAITLAFRALLQTRQVIESNDHQNQATLAAWINIGVTILVDGLVSGLIVMPTSQLWISLYIGCAWGWASYYSHVPNFQSDLYKDATKYFVAGIVISFFMLVFFWFGLLPEIMDLTSYENLELDANVYQGRIARPRIWSTGFF